MGRLLALFIVVPAVELALLIELGRRIGTGWTIALIVATGILGASLARLQGLAVVRAIRREVEGGKLPAGPLLDGALILLASALLVTPGVLTDAVGFACLSPGLRSLVKARVTRWLERAVREQEVHFEMGFASGGARGTRRAPIIDVTPYPESEHGRRSPRKEHR